MNPMRERCANAALIIVDVIRATVAFALKAVRFAIFSVLALLEPLIMWILTAVAVVLCGLIALYGLLQWLHPTHFPFGVVFVLLIGCGLLAVAYYALMYLLMPGIWDSSDTPR